MPKPAPHARTCSLCEAMCGVLIETDGPMVTSIRGDELDPFSRGHICPKAVALGDLHTDPDRLKRPLLRRGETFSEVSWSEAFDHVETSIRAVQRAHGPSAVAIYLGNPTVHNLGAMMFAPDLCRALRTKSRFSATSVDQLPHMLASFLMFGHQLLLPVPDVDRTDLMLIFGANPLASNGSLMSAPGIERRLRDIQARGGRVIVFDPRRTETARMASEHHFVRPGTDALVLLGLLHTLFDEDRISLGHLSAQIDNVAVIRDLVRPFDPERVAKRTGLAPETLRTLARDFAKAKRAVCYGRMGISTQDFGSLACWLVNVLNAVTGHLDSVGGAMFTEPAVDPVARPLLAGRGSLGRWRSRVRGLPEFGGELPVATLAEEIETPGPGQIRALITSAGNPVLSAPTGSRLEGAFAGLDFMVSVDFYLNETTRLADVILPPTGPLEHDHYDLAFHALAVQNTAKYSEALFAKPEGAKHDWEILGELTWRLATGSASKRAKAKALSRAKMLLGPRRLLDIALRTGQAGAGWLPGTSKLSIETLLREPHGIVLGPLAPCLVGRLRTLHRQVDLAPARFVADLPRLEASLADDRTDQFELIGRRHLRSNNSWLHNSQRLVKGKNRCTLLIHPSDAESHGLADGDRARVSSRVGSVEVDVQVSDEIMAGVVSLPHGFGHHRKGTRLSVAERHAGVSVNDLTDDQRIDFASGNASFSGTPVRIQKVDAASTSPHDNSRSATS